MENDSAAGVAAWDSVCLCSPISAGSVMGNTVI